MKIDFVLHVAGNILLNPTDIALNDGSEAGAIEEAQKHVAALHRAGYTKFWVYNVKRDNGADDFPVAAFEATSQEPLITRTK